MKKILCSLFFVVALLLVGCGEESSTELSSPMETLEFDAMLYDNHGQNYVTFRGNNFNITPNRVKQYGYDSDGHWTWWYETSSVMTVEIDGHFVHSCGSTILFKDTRIEIEPITENIGMLESSSNKEGIQTPSDYSVLDWWKLSNWWENYKEKGQNNNVMIIIQSQNGDNIGIVTGENIQWEVAEKLPKTTLITIDGDKKLYIHRSNFTIIDIDLFNKMVR